MAESTYYVTLPNSGVTAEVTSHSTRQARTVYLDYLTRSGVVPWRGRTDLRDQIIIDRIDPGQVPTDVQLAYGQVQETPEEDFELNGNGVPPMDYSRNGYDDLDDYDDYGDYQQPISRPVYQNGASFGGAERQVRSEWDPQGAPEYGEDLPKPSRSGRIHSSGVPSSRIPSPADAGKLGPSQNGSGSMPSPSSKPTKLAGLTSGERIPVGPSGKVGSVHPLNGESRIGRLVRESFPKGKV